MSAVNVKHISSTFYQGYFVNAEIQMGGGGGAVVARYVYFNGLLLTIYAVPHGP